MARTGIKNTKMLLTKPLIFMQGLGLGRFMSGLPKPNDHENTNKVLEEQTRPSEDPSSCWIPHPRSGIYFPKGHEWVMEDIPNDAASFECTFWLRNIDGVDKPDPDNFTHYGPN